MTIIFDYDGTLHNTAPFYTAAVQKAYNALVEEGLAKPKQWLQPELSRFLGVTPSEMWDEFMPELPKNVKERSSRLVGRYMTENIRSDAQLYDGAEQLLSDLKKAGCRLVIMSNCYRDYMDAHRKRFELDRFFVDYFTAEEYSFIPKTKIVPKIIEKYPDCKYALAGDRASDMEAAVQNGIPFIACLYGFADKDELRKYDAVLDLKNKFAFDTVIRAAKSYRKDRSEVKHG